MKKLFVIALVKPISVQHGSRIGVVKEKGKKAKSHIFSDTKRELYFSEIIKEIKHQAPKIPIATRSWISIRFFLSDPDKRYEPGSEAWQDPPPGMANPDFDNMTKAFCDALAKCKFISNDRRFTKAMVEKFWEDGLGPRIECTIEYSET